MKIPRLQDPVAAPAASAITSVAPAIPWRMRADLIVRRQDSGAWVVKDPLTLTYVRLSDQEMAILRSLNGRRTASQLLQALRDTWPANAFSVDDVSDFLGQLIGCQLVVSTQSFQKVTRSDGGIAKPPSRWISRISGLLRLQFRLIDPTTLLDACQPLLSAKVLRAMAVTSAVVVVAAICLVMLRFELFVDNLPGPMDFFGPDNLLLLLLVFVTVKMFHEAGHAIAARSLGAECHEAGVMLLLLTPILYTNVTDAWMLNRRSRLIITAAGILVEVVLASLAAILWFFASPGLVKAMLANTMVICTLGTILFNGNPLLRYDGYFLLVDAIGQPNLAQRSSHRVRQLWEDLMLGRRSESLFDGDRFLLFYGVVSGLYRILLSIAILSMLSHLFDAWGLGILGAIVGMVAALPLVGAPIWAFAAGFFTELSMRSDPGFRLLRASLIFGLLLTAILIPLPQSIIVPAVVEPSGTPVFASLSGQLSSAAQYGDAVERRATVAVLSDPRLQHERLEYQGAVKVHESRLRALELRRQESDTALLPEARALLDSSRTRLMEFEKELERLTVIAPVAGRLVPPRARMHVVREDSLSPWNGHPLDERNYGALIEQGTLLGHLCESSDCDLLLQLDAHNAALLKSSQIADFQATGNSRDTWRGTIQHVAPLSDDDVPAELIVAGLTNPPSVSKASANHQHWQATVRLTIPEDSPAPIFYSTGQVRVYVEPLSMASRVWRFLRTTFGSQGR